MSRVEQSPTREKVAWWTQFTGVVIGVLGILNNNFREVAASVVLFVGGSKLREKNQPEEA